MPTTIVPFDETNRRAPEAGRIRIGKKVAMSGGKDRPGKLDTFRFTSPHLELITKLANIYGGDVEPWNEPKARIKNQWQVTTTSNRIRVYLPPDGISQHYEKWTGGGCERRCDGETVQTTHTVGDQIVIDESPCICMAKGLEECKPHTRLTVILPEIPFYGTWRLDSQGKNARDELPGMYDFIVQLQQQQSMSVAMLTVESRTEVRDGKTRNFVVPGLAVEQSPLEILAGQADVRSISARGEQSAVGATTDRALPRPPSVDEDGVIEGEIVDPDEMELRGKLIADAKQFGLDVDQFVNSAMASDHAQQYHDDIAAGKVEPIGFTTLGKIRWRQLGGAT